MVRRRPYVAIGLAAGLMSLLAVFVAARIARLSVASEVATSVALAPRDAVKTDRPVQVVAPRSVVGPHHPAATRPVPVAPVHPSAGTKAPVPTTALPRKRTTLANTNGSHPAHTKAGPPPKQGGTTKR